MLIATNAYAVKNVAIINRNLPNGQNGVAYSTFLKAKFGTKPYTWTKTGTLPTGLSLNASTGEISGTPSVNGTYSVLYTCTDSAGSPTIANKNLSITIAAGVVVTALQITTGSIPNGTVGSAYSATISATGGTTPYTFSITTGVISAGLTLSSAGAITGTPTAAGNYSFTVRATDASSQTYDRAYANSIADDGTYLFSDGFESGDFSAWSSTPWRTSLNQPSQVLGTIKHAGNYAYSQEYVICGASDGTCGAASQDTNSWIGKVFSTSLSTFWTRGYLYIQTPYLASEIDDLVQRKIMRFSDSGQLPGTQYDFFYVTWTSTGGIVHPTYQSLAFGSQSSSCPFTGTVNTSGTSVTRVSGALFNTNTNQSNGSGPWIGGTITISGVNYTIATVPTTDSLTLTTSAGVQTGVSFSKPWVPFVIYDITNLNYDTWYSLETKVILNTPGVPDGTLILEKDGVEVLNKNTIMFRGYGCSNNVNFFGYGAQSNRYSFNPLGEFRYWDDVVVDDVRIGP